MKRILKQGVSEEVKCMLRDAVAVYMRGKKILQVFKTIFTTNKNKERQLMYQIFKYALIQFTYDSKAYSDTQMGVFRALNLTFPKGRLVLET